jgi:hypothetical protein
MMSCRDMTVAAAFNQSHFTITPLPSSLQRIVVQADSIVHPDESEYRSNPADHPLVVDGMYVYPFFGLNVLVALRFLGTSSAYT